MRRGSNCFWFWFYWLDRENEKFAMIYAFRRRVMKRFEVRLRCCSNVAILMLFVTLEATRAKSTFGYNQKNPSLLLEFYNRLFWLHFRFSVMESGSCWLFSFLGEIISDYFNFHWIYGFFQCAWQIVMEYCGGGSVADLMNVTDDPLEEYQIAYICREALKVPRIRWLTANVLFWLKLY